MDNVLSDRLLSVFKSSVYNRNALIQVDYPDFDGKKSQSNNNQQFAKTTSHYTFF